MNNLQIFKIFENEEFGQVRTVTIDGEPWLVGKDVAEALGYEKARNAIAAHVDEEDKKAALIQGGPGGAQTMTIINESGLYSLIFGSKLESAKRFKHWVTSEVLPALRKNGNYEMPGRSTYDTKATSVGEVVNLVRMQQKVMERRGCSPEDISEMMDATCKQFGIRMPEIFLSALGEKENRVREGLDTDETLKGYAARLREMTAEGSHNFVLEDVFLDFCSQKRVNAEKYLDWLYQNKYIACLTEHGKRSYILNQYIGYFDERGIYFF